MVQNVKGLKMIRHGVSMRLQSHQSQLAAAERALMGAFPNSENPQDYVTVVRSVTSHHHVTVSFTIMNVDMFALDPSVEEVLNISTFEVCVSLVF
jgi:hypothetical protein